MDRIMAAADYLFEMRQAMRNEPNLPESIAPRTLAEAYQVQEHLVKQILAQIGGHPVGYKAAATNLLAQQLLAVDAPLFGKLLSATCHRSGAALSAARFTVRCIEAEFGFEMGADVPPNAGNHTAETVQEYIAFALPSIEIVDHRYDDWSKVGAASLVADNAIHGAWVRGEPYPDWRNLDFAQHPVAVFVNEEPFATGSGANVLGSPLEVLAWLANELPRYGSQLRKGDWITTGTAAQVYYAVPGDRIRADFGPLGQVEVSFVP
jgi:2-keto-4-pentenoate hydratase